MFDYIKGILAGKEPSLAVVDAGGIGYSLKIALCTYEKLPQVSEPVKLFCYMAVREDDISLYGFLDTRERRMFLSLISVSGIGPNIGLRILSNTSIEVLSSAIRDANADLLTQVKGIGKKTAERMILELRNTLVDADRDHGESDSVLADAVSALTGIGYTVKEAEAAVKKAAKKVDSGCTVEEIIRECLKM